MPYPTIAPTSRSYDPGDYANTKYRANSGAEFRIQYGDKRTGMKMRLVYKNITDSQAAAFLTHYDEVDGTVKQFTGTQVTTGTEKGMSSTLQSKVGASGSFWRYEGPPQLTSEYPGRSTVTVNLIGCTNAS